MNNAVCLSPIPPPAPAVSFTALSGLWWCPVGDVSTAAPVQELEGDATCCVMLP